MHIRLRVHRWVLWWFYVGVACGVVAVINILGRGLTRTQEDIVLLIGVVHWLLGGVICYAFDAIKIERPPQQAIDQESANACESPEWHPASDFLLPGNRKSLLPRKY